MLSVTSHKHELFVLTAAKNGHHFSHFSRGNVLILVCLLAGKKWWVYFREIWGQAVVVRQCFMYDVKHL